MQLNDMNRMASVPFEFQFSGKCYNKAENWYEDLLEAKSDDEKNKVAAEPQQSASEPALDEVLEKIEEEVEEAAEEILTDTSDIPATSRAKKIALGRRPDVKNIPAYLPYEAKEALLRKLRAHRNHRQLDSTAATEAGSRVSSSHPGQREFRANYPQVQVQPKDSHFLYGHAPITGYKLPDGSSGTVQKSPRK